MLRRTLALLALATWVLAACGDGNAATVDVPDAPAAADTVEAMLAAHGLDWCEALEYPRAPDDAYRDEPVYVGNEQPTEAVQAWAATKPGYQSLWLDRERQGWITLGFSEGVEARQAELREEFPDVGVVAVRARSTAAERAGARARVEPVLRRFAIGEPTIESEAKGVVEVGLGVLREEVLEALEPYADEPLCFDGAARAGRDPRGPPARRWRRLEAARRRPVGVVVPHRHRHDRRAVRAALGRRRALRRPTGRRVRHRGGGLVRRRLRQWVRRPPGPRGGGPRWTARAR